MAENQLNRQLAAGIRAAQQGDAERARELLEGVLRRDRNNEQGWIWLASVVQSQRERRLSLERVIKINPNNAPAQEALNAMVGVLGGEATVDYAAISAAARTPIPTGRRGEGTTAGQSAVSSQSSGGQNIVPLLIGAAVILGVLLLGAIFVPPLLQPAPTATLLPVIEETVEAEVTVDPLFTPPSPTTRPTATFDPEGVGNLIIDITTVPTFTPTATLPPTETPVPTATLPPLSDYNFLLMAVQGSAPPSIYNLNGDGAGLRNILADIEDFDYNPATGLIVFSRPNFVELPTQAPLPTNTPPLATATPLATAFPGAATETAPRGFVLQSGGTTQSEVIQFQMFIANIGNLDDLTEITSSALPSAFDPSISPDGNYIAFTSDADGDTEIYVYNVETGLASQVTNNLAEDIDPDWSPDGTRIVFSSDRQSAGNNDLFILEPFTVGGQTEVEQVTQSRGSNIEPQWSPTSDELVFLNVNGNSTTVRYATIDGSLTRDLTFRPNWLYSNPSWSPDSNYIMYSSAAPDAPAFEIRIYTPLTQTEQTLRTINLDVLQVIPR